MKRLTAILIAAITFLTLTSCSKSSGSVTDTKYAFNTFIRITLYGTRDTDLLDECFSICDEYEDTFSADKEGSELYKLNKAITEAVSKGIDLTDYEISGDLYHLITTAGKYTDISEGHYNIAERAVFKEWTFDGISDKVPDRQDIEAALAYSGKAKYSIKDADYRHYISVSHTDPALFDLGSCAKGYIADRLKEFLVNQGVRSAVIDLGGNILCIGQKNISGLFKKDQYQDFSIGIQMPYSDDSSISLKLAIDDLSVVTSGIYQRYFVKDGVMYHHIIDAVTGYPAVNDLASVSVIGSGSTECDILSTVFFLIGEEAAKEILKDRPDLYAVFLYTDGSSSYSENLEKLLIN